MTEYSFDATSLIRDGKRWFPVMGEIHYSRYPEQYWKESLLKMKAGGVDIVSSYVIWIHHEEIRGRWDWSGQRNLRKFVETVKECGLTMVLRVGPWSHAEVRNGGFPDWLMAECGTKVRTNDEVYFSNVENFYRNILKQVEGLFLKDGGPVIGVQVENEYGHCGGLCGEEGESHMKRLEKMLRDMGYDVPLYTATGWGGAVTAGMLPVMGGYCDAPWDPRTTEIEPSANFVLSHERNDHAIGSDFGLGEGITFDMTKFPYLTAELGGGLQMTYKRRTIATARDIAAMSLCKMGSGCNLLGYYMYHGGTNPDGKLSGLQETTATGSFCDLPEKTYDFRAPVGEYGTVNGTYKYIRRYASFVHDFGEELCSMETYIPEGNPSHPDDFKSLRYSLRYNKESERGYIFINNYQRRNEMLDHYDAEISFEEPARISTKISVRNGEFRMLPVEKGSVIQAAPLCKLNGWNIYYSPEVNDASSGSGYYLSEKDSLDAVKFAGTSGELLLITTGCAYSEKVGEKTVVHLETRKNPAFKTMGISIKTPAGFACERKSNFSCYTNTATLGRPCGFRHKIVEASEDKVVCKIIVDSWPEDHFGFTHDQFLDIKYTGNCARLYLDGKLVADNLYSSPNEKWSVGLRRFGKEKLEFLLEVDCLRKSQEIYLEQWPEFNGKESLCHIEDIGTSCMYKVDFEI